MVVVTCSTVSKDMWVIDTNGNRHGPVDINEGVATFTNLSGTFSYYTFGGEPQPISSVVHLCEHDTLTIDVSKLHPKIFSMLGDLYWTIQTQAD